VGERVQLLLPEPPVAGDPACRLFEGLGDQAAAVDTAMLLAGEESRLFENPEVLRDSGKRDGKRFREPGDRRLPARQSGEDGPAGWVRQRGEGGVQGVMRIVNHEVKYRHGPVPCQQGIWAFGAPFW